jgi:signal transduction histidine kinase
VGFGLAIALVAASILLAARNDEAVARVAQAQQTRATLAMASSALERAETGQRGFLLTERDDYLEPYRAGASEAPAALDRLEAALKRSRDSADAAEPMAELRRLATDKLEELAQTLAQAQAGNRAGALDIVQSDRGQRDMTAIRDLVAALDARQEMVLAEQIRSVNRAGRMLVAADALGLILLALIAAGVAWGAWRAFGALRAAQSELTEAYAALRRSSETLEERVQERTAALTEANEEIQRFAYIVSHDLRAPLVNIMGFTSEMESAAATIASFVKRAADRDPEGTRDVLAAAQEDIPESIGFIKTSAAKMDRLIGAILKLSREGRRVLAAEPVAMRPLLEGIAASLQHQAESRGAEFSIGPVPDLVSDRLVLEQVFSNLMENALKYGQPGRPGRIVVSGRRSGRQAVFTVADNGRGIAERDLERVFELFRRAGDQDVPGEGIGLAHVRALVRRLGGRIDCVSRQDVGSTFRVEIPQAQGVANPVLEREHAA